MAGKANSNRKDRTRTGVVVATVAGTEVRVLQATRRGAEISAQRWGQAEGGGDEESRARALVQALQQAGIAERRVVLGLPARSVVIKRVQLPPAAPEQLAQLVAYEAQRHLPLPLDQLATGFRELPGAASEGSVGTEVLLAVARKNDLAKLERALSAVGVQVEEYGVEALGVTDAYLPASTPLPNGDARLLLAPEEGGLHAQMLRGDRLLFTRYLPFNSGEWSSDLRRSLAAFSIEHPEAPIQEAVLLGKGDEEQLGQAVGQPLQRADVRLAATGEMPPPAWLPLVGLARQCLGAGHYPLQLPAQGWTDGKRTGSPSQAMVGAFAAVALAGLFVYWQFDQQQAATAQTEQAGKVAQHAAADRKLLDSLLQKREQLQEQLTAMGGQVDGQPEATPLELLRQVTASAPPGIWLNQVTYASDKPLQLEGSTRNAEQVNRFLDALERIPGFQRAEVGFVRSGTLNDTPVTHFRIDCALSAPKRERTSAFARPEEVR